MTGIVTKIGMGAALAASAFTVAAPAEAQRHSGGNGGYHGGNGSYHGSYGGGYRGNYGGVYRGRYGYGYGRSNVAGAALVGGVVGLGVGAALAGGYGGYGGYGYYGSPYYGYPVVYRPYRGYYRSRVIIGRGYGHRRAIVRYGRRY